MCTTKLKAGVRLFFICAVLVSLAVNLVIAIDIGLYQVKAILKGPALTMKEKHRLLQGEYAVYADFIEKNTSARARVLFPPRLKKYRPFDWVWRNNYFLCPRLILYPEETSRADLPSIDYVLIYKDFPDFQVQGEKIMFNDVVGLYRTRKVTEENQAGTR